MGNRANIAMTIVPDLPVPCGRVIAALLALSLFLDTALPAAAQSQPARPGPGNLPAVKDLPTRTEEPDPLVMMDGKPVKTREDCLQRRRPEIVKLVQHYAFGYAAPERLKEGTPPPTVVREDANALGGLATWRHLRVPLAPDPNVFKDLHLLIPNAGAGPFPVILSFGVPGSPRPEALEKKDPNALADAVKAIRRGYAIAAFRHNQSSDNVYTKGIYPHYQPTTEGPLIEHPFGARRMHDWGEIAAWSWCARRMIDVLEREKRIDAKRIATIGGSRTGPASILTGAIDERVAAVIGWQISPFRWRQGSLGGGPWAHWMSRSYSEFDGRRDRMPVEYPCFAAAIAPRPLLLTASPTADFANPDLTAWIANGAAKAYRFLGTDVEDFKRPWTEPGLRGKGPLRMHLRAGGHGYHAADWPAYLDFLDGQFKADTKENAR